MGVLDLITWNAWTITSKDPEVTINLESQFQPDDGVEIDDTPVWGSSVTAGSDRPTLQYVAGGPRTVRFTSSFQSRHQLDPIQEKIDALEAIRGKDATLGRSPLVSFQWSDIEITGLAQIKMRITGFWPVSEWPRRCEFEILIQRADKLDLDGSGDGTATGETQYLTLSSGERFENLARRYLGDPLKGDLLRKINPAQGAQEAAGDRVKVLERTHPAMLETVVPTSPPFLDRTRSGDTWAPVVEDLAEARALEVGVAWDRLPEVLAGEV